MTIDCIIIICDKSDMIIMFKTRSTLIDLTISDILCTRMRRFFWFPRNDEIEDLILVHRAVECRVASIFLKVRMGIEIRFSCNESQSHDSARAAAHEAEQKSPAKEVFTVRTQCTFRHFVRPAKLSVVCHVEVIPSNEQTCANE